MHFKLVCTNCNEQRAFRIYNDLTVAQIIAWVYDKNYGLGCECPLATIKIIYGRNAGEDFPTYIWSCEGCGKSMEFGFQSGITLEEVVRIVSETHNVLRGECHCVDNQLKVRQIDKIPVKLDSG